MQPYYSLIISVLALLVALVLGWMGRPTQGSRKRASAETITIDVQCDATAAMAEIARLKAEIESLDAMVEKTGLRLQVREPSQKSRADRKKPAPIPGGTVEFQRIGYKFPTSVPEPTRVPPMPKVKPPKARSRKQATQPSPKAGR